jgi:pimeloyl-ACP methyl ester carboxylesterase
MKILFFPFLAFLLTITFSHHLMAQEENGVVDTWSGAISVQGQELGIVFHIVEKDGKFSATMDSPDQHAFGIEVDEIGFSNGHLDLAVTSIGMKYEGKYDEERDVFRGKLNQRGTGMELDLARGPYEPREYNRPQTPKEPFAYVSEEVTFVNNKADIRLAGTLTRPKGVGKPPVVILISGSGPQDRNSEIMKHQPFWVLADFLSTHGIAVLRYDERGVGESEGKFGGATSEDFASDVMAAIEYLKKRKDVNKDRIGLIGHSEGGMIAPMVAVQSKDVKGIVLMAGPGVGGDQILLRQSEDIMQAQGMDEADIKKAVAVTEGCLKIIKETESVNDAGEQLNTYLTEAINELPSSQLESIGDNKEAYIQSQIFSLNNPWMRFFIQYDPAPTLKRVKCPVLAINGERDLQVDSEINLQAIQLALEEGGNERVKIVFYPELNHLFQHAETGAPAEYIQIEETFSRDVMLEIMEWVSMME